MLFDSPGSFLICAPRSKRDMGLFKPHPDATSPINSRAKPGAAMLCAPTATPTLRAPVPTYSIVKQHTCRSLRANGCV